MITRYGVTLTDIQFRNLVRIQRTQDEMDALPPEPVNRQVLERWWPGEQWIKPTPAQKARGSVNGWSTNAWASEITC